MAARRSLWVRWLAVLLPFAAGSWLALAGNIAWIQASAQAVWLLPVTLGAIWLAGAALTSRLAAALAADLSALQGGMKLLLNKPAADDIAGSEDAGTLAAPETLGLESGQLAEAFQALQRQIRGHYQEVERELQLAYDIQTKLLPGGSHRFGRYDVACNSLPAREVGGDLYDVQPLGGSRFAFIIGDVSGSGLPAALLMSAVISLFRSELQRGGSTSAILMRMNRLLAESLQADMMVTLGIGIMDGNTGELHYSSAGHLAPYVANGPSVREWPFSSFPLGIDEEAEYEERTLTLQPGESLILCTDGVIEAGDAEGGLLGFGKFAEWLGMLPDSPAEQQLTYLADRVAVWGSGSGFAAEPGDDRTLMVIRRHDEGADRL